MDRKALEELYSYTDFSWARHAKVMEELPPGQFATPVPGSGWPSLRDCFSHFVQAYDGWINGHWGLGLGEMSRPKDLTTWDEMAAYRVRGREAFRKALDCPDEVLYEKRTFDWGDGETEHLARGDILGNLLMHERGHHGDISTLLHTLGIKSPIVDYRFFVSFPDRFIYDEEDSDD